MIVNDPERWGSVAKFLHWTMALLILGMIGLGWIASLYPVSPTKLNLFLWHKSIGLSLLCLVLIRLLWRAAGAPPKLPDDMPGWEQTLARCNHAALYLLMVVMPVSGYVIHSTADFSFRFFGWLRVPNLIAPDESWQRAAEAVHLAASWVLILLIVAHVSAALRHHIVHKNNVLIRMLPLQDGRTPAGRQ